MSREENIDQILNELVERGSQIDYLNELRKKSLELASKDFDLDEVLSHIAKDIKEQTEIFLNQKNNYETNYISGISTCIYLPDFDNNGEYKLKIFGGKGSRSKSLKINEQTLFDISSITKLYTLILLFNLEQQGLIDLNSKISEVNPDFSNLNEVTINDLISFYSELNTTMDINCASSPSMLYKILKTTFVSNKGTEDSTDISALILSDTIEQIVSKNTGKDMSFEDIMYEYLLNPLNLFQTQFNPISYNLSGNGNKQRFVQDHKAKLLGGAIGSAGLFATSEDLTHLAKSLYVVNYANRGLLKKHNLDRLGQNNQNYRGNLGLCVKPFSPSEFSKGSFSKQAYNGSFVSFDPNNLIHSSILVNAVYNNSDKDLSKDDKPIGFDIAFEEYKLQIIKNIMLMYIAKQYYNKYCNVKEDINVTKYI